MADVESAPRGDAHSSEAESDSDSDSVASDASSVANAQQALGSLGNRLNPTQGLVISQDRAPAGPAFGSIAVTSCADVHFGNKTYYKGPVTIKQFLYGANPNGNANGALTNGGFESEEKDNPNLKEVNSNATFTTGNGHVLNSQTTPNPHCKGTQLVRELWEKWRVKERRKTMVLGGIALCGLLVVLVTTLLLIPGDKSRTESSQRPREDDNKNIPIKTDIGIALLNGPHLRLVARQEWVAQPPEHPANPLNTPVPYVVITHTATENCTDQASCTFHVRFIQTFHMESRHWWDIGYNFLVGGDGAVYEGRGWDSEGAHTKGYNNMSIGIAFIGTFNDIMPPERQLNAAERLIEEGVKLEKISPAYKLFGHRQLIPSLSPGDRLYNEIKSWPHWTNTTT